MLILNVIVVVLFGVYFVTAEWRIYRATRQRNYWHERFLQQAYPDGDVTETADQIVSQEAPPKQRQ